MPDEYANLLAERSKVLQEEYAFLKQSLEVANESIRNLNQAIAENRKESSLVFQQRIQLLQQLAAQQQSEVIAGEPEVEPRDGVTGPAEVDDVGLLNDDAAVDDEVEEEIDIVNNVDELKSVSIKLERAAIASYASRKKSSGIFERSDPQGLPLEINGIETVVNNRNNENLQSIEIVDLMKILNGKATVSSQVSSESLMRPKRNVTKSLPIKEDKSKRTFKLTVNDYDKLLRQREKNRIRQQNFRRKKRLESQLKEKRAAANSKIT